MAVQIMTISIQPDVRERLVADAEATGLKLSAIIRQALIARWEAQEAA